LINENKKNFDKYAAHIAFILVVFRQYLHIMHVLPVTLYNCLHLTTRRTGMTLLVIFEGYIVHMSSSRLFESNRYSKASSGLINSWEFFTGRNTRHMLH